MKGKYLITCDNWFVAPDGHSYLAVWGDCETVTAESALGLVPNRNSANWFVKVSNNGEEMIVAGCQIHYAASCPDRPNTDKVDQSVGQEGRELRDTRIYIPGEGKGLEKALAADKSDFVNDGWMPEQRAEDYIYSNNYGNNPEFIEYFLEKEPFIRAEILRQSGKIEFDNLVSQAKIGRLKWKINKIIINKAESLTFIFRDRTDWKVDLFPF